jgi:hypothetical protein
MRANYRRAVRQAYGDTTLSKMLDDKLHRARAFAVALFTGGFAAIDCSEDRTLRFSHPPATLRMLQIMNWGAVFFGTQGKLITPNEWAADACVTAHRLVDIALGITEADYLDSFA